MNAASSSSNQNLVKKWVEEYADSLFQWALHKTSNKEISEDLVQETFIAAYKNISKFNESSKAKTWLFGILKHKILDYYRVEYKNKTESISHIETYKGVDDFFDSESTWNGDDQPGDWDLEKPLLDQVDFLKVLDSCMDNLPESWASAMKLKYLSTKKANEICQELEISTTNYWQILHRAKLNLRNCIEHKWF